MLVKCFANEDWVAKTQRERHMNMVGVMNFEFISSLYTVRSKRMEPIVT